MRGAAHRGACEIISCRVNDASKNRQHDYTHATLETHDGVECTFRLGKEDYSSSGMFEILVVTAYAAPSALPNTESHRASKLVRRSGASIA